MPRFPRTARAIAAIPAAGLTMTLLAACGGGATADTAAGTDALQTAADGTTGATGASGGQGGTQPRGARQLPGASGKIAEIDGSTMQVQNTSTQTAVSWTKDTTFTDTVSAKSSDLAVGDCVAVTPTSTDTTTTTDETAPVAAASISISDAVEGACGFGGGGVLGGGGFRGGQVPDGGQASPGQGATDSRETSGRRPDGAQGNRMGFRGGASGKVVTIDGGTITIELTRPQLQAQGSTPTAPTTATTSRTVTFTSATAWTQTESADSDALKVGRCVTALGTAGSTGAVTATSIVIRPATNGECAGGLVSRGLGAPASATAGA